MNEPVYRLKDSLETHLFYIIENWIQTKFVCVHTCICMRNSLNELLGKIMCRTT